MQKMKTTNFDFPQLEAATFLLSFVFPMAHGEVNWIRPWAHWPTTPRRRAACKWLWRFPRCLRNAQQHAKESSAPTMIYKRSAIRWVEVDMTWPCDFAKMSEHVGTKLWSLSAVCFFLFQGNTAPNSFDFIVAALKKIRYNYTNKTSSSTFQHSGRILCNSS